MYFCMPKHVCTITLYNVRTCRHIHYSSSIFRYSAFENFGSLEKWYQSYEALKVLLKP